MGSAQFYAKYHKMQPPSVLQWNWMILLINLNTFITTNKEIICNEDKSSCIEPLMGEEALIAEQAMLDGESQLIMMGRNAIPGREVRWPDGVVPFVLHPKLLPGVVKILFAMNQYTTQTCIRFVPRSTEKNYVQLIDDHGCYSYIGMLDEGAQPVSLSRGCMYTGTIVHELGHAIGFYHEQSRSDRDDYIKINLENVNPQFISQFDKLDPNDNVLFNEFDYDSIMLYGEYAFSKDRKSKSMEDINSTHRLIEPYNKPGLTRSDAFRINQMYECHSRNNFII